MIRTTLMTFAVLASLSANAQGYQEPQALDRQCFKLAPGETLAITATKDQSQEYMKIAKALGAFPTLKVKEARLQTFIYDGNPGNTAILSFELDNGMKFEAPANQFDPKDARFTIEDDGGGYDVIAAGPNRIVLLDQTPARIDLLVTPDELKEIETKAQIMFEGGTGSLRVKVGQSALFETAACP